MEGPSSKRMKRNNVPKISDIAGHIGTRDPNQRDFPCFPGPRRFCKTPWMPKLLSNITSPMRLLLRQWRIEGLVVHAKHAEKCHMNWAAMGALVELWHPATHTFIFPTFEATILLEETELLLGLRKTNKDNDMMIMPRRMTSRGVLQELIGSEVVIGKIVNKRGINLYNLATWAYQHLQKATTDEEIEKGTKGFVICLAGNFLFPNESGILEEDQLSAIVEIWGEGRLGPSVLAHLYSGLTSAATGHPPHGCMLLLALWFDLHFCFDFIPTGEKKRLSRMYQHSPIYCVSNAVQFEDNMLNRFPDLKTRADWREHFSTMTKGAFTHAPKCFLSRPIQIHHSPGVELRLIGASEIVLYNPHRALPQIGLPRIYLEDISFVPRIRKRKLGIEQDLEEARTVVALWKTSRLQMTALEIEEEPEKVKDYIRQLKVIRAKGSSNPFMVVFR